MSEHDLQSDGKGGVYSFSQLIIVRRDRPLFMVERSVYVILCFISPFIYAWYAVFGVPQQGSRQFRAMLGMEIFFLFNIIFTFFVELNVEGLTLPVRDLYTIAVTYIKGHFLFELLPLIPLQFVSLGGQEKLFYLIKIMRIARGLESMDPTQITEKLTEFNLNRIKKII